MDKLIGKIFIIQPLKVWKGSTKKISLSTEEKKKIKERLKKNY